MYPVSDSSAQGTQTQTASGRPPDGPLAIALKRFLHGFINLRTMPLPLRVATLAGFVLLGSVAVTLALSTLSQPSVMTPLHVNGQTTQTPLLAFLMVVVVFGGGLAYALAGAMSLPWLPRLVIVALVTWSLFYVAQVHFLPGSATDTLYLALDSVVVPIAQFTLLAALWLWALGVSLARWRRRRQRDTRVAGNTAPSSRHITVPIVLALVFIFVFFGLDLIPWALGHATSAAVGLEEDQILIGVWSLPVTSFALFASLFVYWFSTDSTEWATTLTAGIARLTARIPWLTAAVTAAVAIAIFSYDLFRGGSQLIAPLIAIAGVAVVAALVVFLGPSPTHWPDAVPQAGLAASVLTLFAIADLPVFVSGSMVSAGVISTEQVPAVIAAISIVVTLVAVFLALALAAWGRLRNRGSFAITGLLIMLVALTLFIAEIGQTQTALGISWLPQPADVEGGIETVLALATLGLLIGLVVRWRSAADVAAALTGPLIAMVGLQVIDWYAGYALGRLNASAGSLTLVAVFFLASQVWDVARSGGPITNGDSPSAPRASRVLVYFGYVLVAAGLFLYASSLRVTATGAAAPQYLLGEDNAAAIVALFVLCVPLALVTGFMRFQQWRAIPLRAAAFPIPRRSSRARLIFAGIVSLGTVLTVVTGLLLAVYLAQAPGPPSIVYSTTTPGPNCDTHGATWTILPDVETRCQSDGLHVTASKFQTNFVGFTPPGTFGSLPNNYRATVRVDLGGVPGTTSGCAGFGSRLSGRGEYEGIVCSSGAWALRRVDQAQITTTVLASGFTAPSQNYTVSLTADGDTQSLAVNGVQVASVTDATFETGSFGLVVVNLTVDPETAAFSDFTFTSLA